MKYAPIRPHRPLQVELTQPLVRTIHELVDAVGGQPGPPSVVIRQEAGCGCCSFTAPDTDCVVQCTYTAIAYNFTATTWDWTIVGGTIISGGDGFDFAVVETTASANTAFTLSVQVTDGSAIDVSSQINDFEHCHENDNVPIVFIGPPINDVCWLEGNDIGEFDFKVVFTGGPPTTYELIGTWPAGLTIGTDPSDQTTFGVLSGIPTGIALYPDVTVRACGPINCASTNLFEVCVKDPATESLDLSELTPGDCTYNSGLGETGCTAVGEYLATPSGFSAAPDSWLWEISSYTGNLPIIIFGQGTDTIQVQHTGSVMTSITLRCTAANSAFGESATRLVQFFFHHDDTVVDITFPGPNIDDFHEVVGVPFSEDISSKFAGTITGYSKVGTWPAWMDLSSVGVISGNPPVIGVWSNLRVRATNAVDFIESNLFLISVTAPAPVFVGPLNDLTYQTGTVVSLDISGAWQQGINAPTSYTIANHPTWLSITNAGVLQGTAGAVAVTPGIIVTGHNSSLVDAPSNDWTMTVTAIPIVPPEWTTVNIPDIYATKDVPITPYDVSVHFTGGLPMTFAFTGAATPGNWLQLDPTSGFLTGTPLTDTDTSGLQITATNGGGSAQSNLFATIVDLGGCAPLFIGNIDDIIGYTGVEVGPIDVSADWDPSCPVTGYVFNGQAPPWLNISSVGVITGIPLDDTDYTNVEAIGSNAYGIQESNLFDVIIAAYQIYLNLPLLENRYEVNGTNHALLSRATTALVSVRNGGIIGGYQVAEINEFRFQDTYRYSLADSVDYGAGVLGVKYEDTELSSDGLVINETGDNLIIWSEQFEADTWYQQSGAIVTDNQVVAPNGATSGALLELPSTGSYLMNLCDDPFDPPIDPYTFSVYIKKAATNPTTHVIINITGGGWGGAASSTLKVTPTDQWIRYDVWGNFFSNMNCFIGSVNIDGFDDPDVRGNVLVWGAQVNRNQVVNAYYPTSGFAVSQEYDDVHCLWPAGVVNDFTLSVEWMPTMTKACTILETGNFRLFWTGAAVNVTNGTGTAVFPMTLVPYTLYAIQIQFSSIDGKVIRVNGVAGTPSGNTGNVGPATDLQIGARSNLTEFINGTIKNINMTSEPLPPLVLDPPVFTGSIPPMTGTEGVPIADYDSSINFTGGAVETYSLTGTVVSWLQINPTTGVISGTPTSDADFTGVTVTGTNASGSDTSTPFAITIEAPPLEAPIFDGAIPLLTATEGVEDLNMYDASTHYTTGGAVETYSLVNAPVWLTIGASTGIIGGTPPSDTNVISAYVVGTNASGSDNSNTFNVDVSAIPLNPPVFTGNIADITVDEGTPNWSRDVSGEWTGTVTSYSLTGEPSWLTIDVNGVLHGSPVGADSATGVIATATNADGSADSNQFDVTAIVLQPPVWTSDIIIPAQEVDAVFSYDTSVHVTGATSYQLQSDPSGLFQVDGGTGVLSTIAATLPSTPVTISDLQVRAINADGNSSSNVFGFEVEAGAGYGTDLVWTYETTTPDEVVGIGTTYWGTYNATIYWGDGTDSHIANYDANTHTYASPGVHEIRVVGTYTSLLGGNPPPVNSLPKFRELLNLGHMGYTNLASAFKLATGGLTFTSGDCDTSAMTSMSNMFTSSPNFTAIDVSTMDTALCTNMSAAFLGASISVDASSWSIASMTNGAQMFFQSQLNTTDYDATLIAWAAQATIQPNVTVSFGTAKYSAGAAAAAKAVLVGAPNNWTITDGGPV